MRVHVPHLTGNAEHHEHHVRDGISAAADASADLLATLFTDAHHEPWEDAVRRYDVQHAPAQTEHQP